MKFFSIVAVATLAAAILGPTAAQAHGGTFLSCGEVGGGRRLNIDYAQTGVEATLSGRVGTFIGTFADHTVMTFRVADWQDPEFLSLEIKEVNGRFIGVLIEPATSGPAAYQETVFSCVAAVSGAASSNGG